MHFSPPISSEYLEFLTSVFPQIANDLEGRSILEAMQLVRALSVKEICKGVTNLSMSYTKVSGFTFAYSYTRQNLHFASPPCFSEIYPGVSLGDYELTYASFHSSCQGAIASLFIALQMIDKDFYLSSFLRPYFETPLALELLNKGQTKQTGEKILLVDSTYFEPEHVEILELQLDTFQKVLIDTSLWAWDDPLFLRVLKIIKGKKDIFIVRSHLKLDCLGGEYSTLGSLVYLASQETPSSKKEEFIKFIQKASSSIGACPSLDQIYPFYKNEIFHQLTKKRIFAIQDSLDKIKPKVLGLVDETKIEIELPYHRLFFILHFKTNHFNVKVPILKVVKLYPGPVGLIDSYGFEFPSVQVSNVTDTSDEFFIRFNGHNLNTDKDDEIIEIYKQIIEVANKHALVIPKK